jgi:hypothetical protein
MVSEGRPARYWPYRVANPIPPILGPAHVRHPASLSLITSSKPLANAEYSRGVPLATGRSADAPPVQFFRRFSR